MTNEILVELIQAGENTADNMQKLWEQKEYVWQPRKNSKKHLRTR